MASIAENISNIDGEHDEFTDKIGQIGLVASIPSFLLGILALIIFVVVNLCDLIV